MPILTYIRSLYVASNDGIHCLWHWLYYINETISYKPLVNDVKFATNQVPCIMNTIRTFEFWESTMARECVCQLPRTHRTHERVMSGSSGKLFWLVRRDANGQIGSILLQFFYLYVKSDETCRMWHYWHDACLWRGEYQTMIKTTHHGGGWDGRLGQPGGVSRAKRESYVL